MKRFVSILSAALMILAALPVFTPIPAQARFPRGSASVAPILQSVSVPFGASTPALRGYVFLNSLDVTTTANQPQTFSGLDLWVGGSPCVTWTQTFVSGRSSLDYTLIAADTTNPTAVTPYPTSIGAANATGTYVFSTTCKDAGGNISNTVNLTYVTVANAVNLGALDRIDFGVTPAGFGSVAGAQILLSVGADFHAPGANQCCVGLRFDSGAYANQVTITNADNARRPYLNAFTITDSNTNSGMANYRVTNLVLSGQIGQNQLIAGFLTSLTGGADNIVWDNIHGYFSSAYILGTWGAQQTGNAWDALGCKSGATACGISSSDFDYVGTGAQPENNSYIKTTVFRHYYNNALFFGSSSTNADLEDIGIIAPMISFADPSSHQTAHVDSCQIGDGATPSHVTMKRILVAQGDGNTQVQGCPFRGSILNTNCYQDDGTGTHGAGLVLTCPGGFQTSSNGSIIVIPSHYTYSSNAVLTLTSGTTGTLANVAAAVIGSPGSPVQTYSAGAALDFNIDGIISDTSEGNGYGTWGEGGTSFLQDFTLFQMNATPAGEASFTASIDNATGIMTVTSVPTTNYPGETPCLVDCGRVWVSGVCDYCGPNVDHQLTGTTDGIGTYQLSSWGLGTVTSQTIKVSRGYAIPDGTANGIDQGQCTVTALHTGTYTVRNGATQGGTSFCGAPITNTVTSNVLTSTPAANYASGLTPQAYLQSKTWSSRVSVAPILTNAQILTMNCLAAKPKIGGGLDLGGGLWLGSVTGETNSVTHTGGGNWTTNNGTDSGIAISGCSAAP